MISTNRERDEIYFNESRTHLNKIIVVKVNQYYVKDIISERSYGIFGRFDRIEYVKFIGQYMVYHLHPLELLLDDKTKKYITKEEIISFLSPRIEEEPTSKYRDINYKKYMKQTRKLKLQR